MTNYNTALQVLDEIAKDLERLKDLDLQRYAPTASVILKHILEQYRRERHQNSLVRLWAYSDDGEAETDWQKGYEAAKSMVQVYMDNN